MVVTVQVFELPYCRGETVQAPVAKLLQVPSFTVDAEGHDRAKAAAVERLAAYHWDVRSLSFGDTEGSKLVAVIFRR